MRRELARMTKNFETNNKNRPIQSKYTDNGPKSLENHRDNEPPTTGLSSKKFTICEDIDMLEVNSGFIATLCRIQYELHPEKCGMEVFSPSRHPLIKEIYPMQCHKPGKEVK